MSVAALARMTADEFLAWAEARPEGRRWELVAGEPLARAPERSAHALTKADVWLALRQAIRAAGMPCTAYPDGMAVVIDERTVYEPDALVRCGERLAGDVLKITDPVIVVEVLSPSSPARDAGAKLADYVRLPTLRHYLIVDTTTAAVIHHQIDEGAIRTHVLRSGSVDLDPPGITISLDLLFPQE